MDVRPLRILLVDDHEMVLEGLRSMLRRYESEVAIVGTTTDAADAVRLARELEPDIVLLDVRMRARSGFELCEELETALPAVKVVMLSVYEDEQYVFRALEVGAAGYLTKQVSGEDLVAQLRRVMAGEIVVDPALAGRVALSASRRARGEFWPGAHLGLSQRESEVLGLLVQGASNRLIATRLMLGEETVKSHVSAILRKLNVADRTQAVAMALREGIYL